MFVEYYETIGVFSTNEPCKVTLNELSKLGFGEFGSTDDPRVAAKAWNICDTNAKFHLQEILGDELNQILSQCPTLPSRKAESDSTYDAPEGLDYLPYQKAGLDLMLAKQSSLLADDMGLGKTIQYIGFVNNCPELQPGSKILLLCPAPLKINWKREFTKWLTKDMTVGIVKGNTIPDTDIVITNYESLARVTEVKTKREKLDIFMDTTGVNVVGSGLNIHITPSKINTFDYSVLSNNWEKVKNFIQGRYQTLIDGINFVKNLKQIEWDCLGADEAHYVKNEASKRGNVFYQLMARRKILMTGTPMANRPNEIYHLVNFVDPTVLNMSYRTFTDTFCNGHNDKYAIYQDKGCSNAPLLQYLLRSTCMIRRKKLDVLKDLPPKLRQVVPIGADVVKGAKKLLKDEQAAMQKHESLLQSIEALISQHEEAKTDEEFESNVKKLKADFKVAMHEIATLRQKTALAKAPIIATTVIDWIRENDAQKVVVSAHHKDVMEALMKVFKDKAVKVVGGMSPEQKQASVDAFQNDPKVQIFVGSIMAANVGLTLTAADKMVFAELTWVPSELMQMEDRIYRIGQAANRVLIQHMVLEDSIDMKMAHSIVEKMNVIDKVLDAHNTITIETKNPKTIPNNEELRNSLKRLRTWNDQEWQDFVKPIDLAFLIYLRDKAEWTHREAQNASRVFDQYQAFIT